MTREEDRREEETRDEDPFLKQQAHLILVEEALKSAQPELVVVPSEACARRIREVVPRAETLLFAPDTFKQMLDRVLALARALGVLQDAMEWIGSAERAVADGLQRSPGDAVVLITGADPPRIGGYWSADLVELAGGDPVLTTRGEPPRVVSTGDIGSANADFVFLAPAAAGLAGRIRDAARPGAEAAVILPEHLALYAPVPGLYTTIRWLRTHMRAAFGN